MRFAHLYSLLLLTTVGCHHGFELSDDLEASFIDRAVVNGKTDSGHLAVGALISGGNSTCTATLVGKHTVVTAAHCVMTSTKPYKLKSPVNLYLGGYPSGGTKYTAYKVITHPSYDGGNKSDLAVIILGKDVTTITPQIISSTPPKAGETIVMVGYGLIGEKKGSFGTKRMATNTISSVSASTYYIKGSSGFHGNICNGDSGGPSFASRNGKDVCSGVHSTKTNYCGYAATDMRVDAFRSWISTQASGDIYSGSPPDKEPPQVVMLSPLAGAETARTFTASVLASDDIGVTKVVCYLDAKVMGTLTAMPYDFPLKDVTLGSHTLEVVAHDAFGRTSSAAIAITVKDKVIPPAKKAFGETCSKHTDCQSNICLTATGGPFCTKMCSKPADCPSTYTCKNSVCQKKGSTPPPPPPTKKKYGEICTSGQDCQSGLCVRDNGAGRLFCTKKCNPQQAQSCAQGSVCIPAGGQNICVPQLPVSAEEEGCSVATHGSAPLFPPLLLVFLLWIFRRYKA